MTQATKFFNWSGGLQPGPPYTQLSPNLRLVREEVTRRFGGYQLGGYGVRPIAGSARWSPHAFGAAVDTSWATRVGGPGILWMQDYVLPFLVEFSAELGIQVVHHYGGWTGGPHAGANRWKAGTGWYRSPLQAGDWVHYEVHPDEWNNQVPIEQRLRAPTFPPGVQIPVFAPERGQWSLWPLGPKPVLRLGATGDAVRYLQGVMRLKAGQTQIGTVDGVFGNKTLSGVLNVQRFFTPDSVDGTVGPKTWSAIDYLAGV